MVKCAVLHSTASESTARRYCSHAAAFGAWAWVEGIAGDGSELFRLDLIERYIEVGMPSAAESTRATRRSILRRIARHVSPDLKNLPAPTPLPYRRVRPPYSNDEVAGYFRLARSQPTEARHQSVAGVLLLGLGCGMDCRDLGWVRGSDVTMSDGVITVRVCGGSRPRTVVCLANYEAPLWELAQLRGESLLVGGQKLGRHNITSNCLAAMITDSTMPRLVPARLRSTWMFTHLQLGTPYRSWWRQPG